MLGQSRQAAAMLDEARATIGRRKMAAGAIGARLSYLSALVAFQQKRIPEGNAALAAAMGYMQHGSLWLFHIALADELYVGGGATPRVAMDLFTDVLRDPQPADWASDPMESLASLITPHPLPLEHWFEVAVERKDTLTAIEIAERARRHRFFTFAGVRRPVGVVAMAAGSPAGLSAAAGPTSAARPAGPLSGLRQTFAAGTVDPRGAGPKTAGGRRSSGAAGADAGVDRVGRRQHPTGGHPAGDCPAPGAGRAWSFRRCARCPTCRKPCPTNRPCWASSPPAGACTDSC